ncbi:MAG: hypothetical protein COW00_13805 [Bdellovibrio sp. CG12_big_fil_rev_8_21_14_0_65_39_13]|nr:MAG: hypothetical protein COW78_07230 [Bdellovibrio sp. CG22_combo_CG10-13_8_21_14_all_39_27]PIQ58688.1 MAG: hypothetical protein COW00_13805 [Bdellovibrio sp. CG12_big_fil_rev_8_21_14_0_65_39_13]PIR33063.1 MAG: hypothetical protein COV37_18400 [Bdellovibrio sp. CG11_big_fil_rev_8_21_14_0_20_39_38]
MDLKRLFEEISVFSKEKHGSTDYYKEELFVMGESENEFAPLKYLIKKLDFLQSDADLKSQGFVCDSYDLYDLNSFDKWYEYQFSQKLKRSFAKNISLLLLPNNKAIFDAVELAHKSYDVLKKQNILLNSKNLPVQLGEWYSKCIFGLNQTKSASQRGFDFYIGDKRVEIKVSWNDVTSPKGVKIRKSLVDLSDYCIIMYIGRNFMIREICFLDSDFVARKFGGKGHTVFLKDSDVSQYFFSQSTKHVDKVSNPVSLLKFSSPTFAMKIAENFPKQN